jgi:hypothetical protein
MLLLMRVVDWFQVIVGPKTSDTTCWPLQQWLINYDKSNIIQSREKEGEQSSSEKKGNSSVLLHS